jgi:hypothetical protein
MKQREASAMFEIIETHITLCMIEGYKSDWHKKGGSWHRPLALAACPLLSL